MLNYVVGFTYGGGFRNEYNRTFYRAISNIQREKKIKNTLICCFNLPQVGQPELMLQNKFIYKPEKETYIFNYLPVPLDNPDNENMPENSPIYAKFREKTTCVNTGLQTAVYYLMKL